MNNNQANLNTDPQIANTNNQNEQPISQGRFFQNINQPLNVIPENNLNQEFNQPINNFQSNNDNTFIQNENNYNNQINEYNDQIITQEENTAKFINNNIENTTLNDLNIDDTYNNTPKVNYSRELKVQENLKKNNTITITSEAKVFILIIIVLLLFIIVMPYISDFISNIKYS